MYSSGVCHGDAATLLTGTDLGPADHLAVAIPDFYPVVVLTPIAVASIGEISTQGPPR